MVRAAAREQFGMNAIMKQLMRGSKVVKVVVRTNKYNTCAVLLKEPNTPAGGQGWGWWGF